MPLSQILSSSTAATKGIEKLNELIKIYNKLDQPHDENDNLESECSVNKKKRKIASVAADRIQRHIVFTNEEFWIEVLKGFTSLEDAYELEKLCGYWHGNSKFSFLDNRSLLKIVEILECISTSVEQETSHDQQVKANIVSLKDEIRLEKAAIARVMFARLQLLNDETGDADVQFVVQERLKNLGVKFSMPEIKKTAMENIENNTNEFVDYIEKYGDDNLKQEFKSFHCFHRYDNNKPPILVPAELKKYIPKELKKPNFLFRGNNQRINYFIEEREFLEELAKVKSKTSGEIDFQEMSLGYEVALNKLDKYKSDIEGFRDKMRGKIISLEKRVKRNWTSSFRKESNMFFKAMHDRLKVEDENLERHLKVIEEKKQSLENTIKFIRSKEKEIKDIEDNQKNAYRFYKRLNICLNEFCTGLRGGASGFVSIERKSELEETTGLFGKLTSFLNSVRKLPILRLLTGNIIVSDIASGLLSAIGSTRQFNSTQSISKAFGLESEARELILSFSLTLTKMYLDNIENLAEEKSSQQLKEKKSWIGNIYKKFVETKQSFLKESETLQSEALADFIVMVVVTALFDGTINLNEPLLAQFISVVIQPEEKEGVLQSTVYSMVSDKVETKDGKVFPMCEFFHKVGIKIKGEQASTLRYFDPIKANAPDKNIEIHGYRFATENEEEKLKQKGGDVELKLKELPTNASSWIATAMPQNGFSSKSVTLPKLFAPPKSTETEKLSPVKLPDEEKTDLPINANSDETVAVATPIHKKSEQLKIALVLKYVEFKEIHVKNKGLTDKADRYIEAIGKVSVNPANEDFDKFKTNLKTIVKNVSYYESMWSAKPLSILSLELLPFIDSFDFGDKVEDLASSKSIIPSQ
jgi:hypothetical protein